MSFYSRIMDWLEQTAKPSRDKHFEQVKAAGEKRLEKANHRPLTEGQKTFVESMAKQAIGEKKPTAKDRVASLPMGMRKGNRSFETDRDVAYCPCGHLKAEHSTLSHEDCPCERTYYSGE